MNYVIQGYEPEQMFRYFEEISAIPRSSGQEGRVADYLEAFAREHGLACRRDEHHNVILKKPGRAGGEQAPAVMLQSHTDMVCVKEYGVEHDFERDGLKLYIEDGWLKARGTTLGADDAQGMMLMLQALADTEHAQPPLECVFTAQEEVGLVGARLLDMGDLESRMMINLDGGPEGNAVCGCAGGVFVRLRRELADTAAGDRCGLTVSIRGLRGGHSGFKDNLERGNANKLMGRVLYRLQASLETNLVKLAGGTKDNAIPCESEAVLAFGDDHDRKRAMELVDRMAGEFREEFGANEPGLTVAFAPVVEPLPPRVVTAADTRALAELLYQAPHGIRRRNLALGDSPVASLNFAIVRAGGGEAELSFSPRSSVRALQEETKELLALLGARYGCAVAVENEYPGWAYAERSPLRDLYAACCKEALGIDLHVEAIHAGLECGLFSDRLPGLDAISVGVNAEGGHMPRERMELSSCTRAWKLLALVLERLAGAAADERG